MNISGYRTGDVPFESCLPVLSGLKTDNLKPYHCFFGALHSLLAICSCCFSTLLCYVFMPLFGIFLCVFLLFLGSFSNWLSLFLLFVQVWKNFFSHLFSTTYLQGFFKEIFKAVIFSFFSCFFIPPYVFCYCILVSIAFDKVGFHFLFWFHCACFSYVLQFLFLIRHLLTIWHVVSCGKLELHLHKNLSHIVPFIFIFLHFLYDGKRMEI